MISAIQGFCLVYGLIDFSLQILAQMPFIKDVSSLEMYGFRKIWNNPNPDRPEHVFDYGTYINEYGDPHVKRTLFLDQFNLAMQFLNCVIITTIMLQSEIFDSAGYLKFVTRSGGTMDVLIQLAEVK